MSLPTFPLPDLPDPAVSPAPCVFRFRRAGKGTRKLAAGTPYSCSPAGAAPVPSVRVKTTITFNLSTSSPALPCDETAQLFPAALTLNATGVTLYRADGFGVFAGPAEVVSGGSVLFKGRLELFDRTTLQQAPLVQHPPGGPSPCDLGCRPENHLEGWLVVGGSTPATERLSIRALLGGVGKLPSPVGSATPSAAITNVVVVGAVVKG